ncbi:hypothetical protein HN713_01645 [bacterium]|nr:hypothetical protein [bacterium]
MKKFFVLIFLFLAGNVFAVRDIVISEIAWMGTDFSANDEWIELQNATSNFVDLTGWTLISADGSPSILLAGQIAANGFFLLERTDDTTTSVAADQIYTGGLANIGEELILKNTSGTEIDRTPAGVWAAGESSVPKKTMERADFSADGTLFESWQTFLQNSGTAIDAGGAQILGTPRAPNSVFSPPPPSLAFVSALASAQISEICPVAIGGESEWFEFSITADGAVDLTDFQISNGGAPKNFSTGILTLGSGGTPISDSARADADGIVRPILQNFATSEMVSLPAGNLIFLPAVAGEPMFFSFSPSIVSLSDGGGNLGIFDSSGNLLDQIPFPATKSGTADGIAYSEIWNRHVLKSDTLWPQVSSENFPTHTRGFSNSVAPTFPDDIEFVISEFSPDRGDPQPETDFVELIVRSSFENPANLKSFELKHNGTRLVFFPNNFFVSSGDRIVVELSGAETFSHENGVHTVGSLVENLSSGSGTLEAILFSGTSWEIFPESGADPIADFVCWKNETLSQIESERVAKNFPQNWNDDCLEISNLIANESRARHEFSIDSGTVADFFRHFLGSPGAGNFDPNPANSPPIPNIKVQGTARLHETSLNFTGFDSADPIGTTSDPDGAADLKNFQWTIDGKNCGDFSTDFWEWRKVRTGEKTCAEESSNPNPDRVYFNFDAKEFFEITLAVSDFSGASASISAQMNRDPFGVGGAPNVFDASLKKWIAKEFSKKSQKNSEKKSPNPNHPNFAADETFFSDFLAVVDLKKLQQWISKKTPPHQPRVFSAEVSIKKISEPEISFSKKIPKTSGRRKFSPAQRQQISKNLGLVFTLPATNF